MYKRDITQFQSFDFGRLLPTIASGSLGSLKKLYLYSNQIGDDGMKAFSDAIASGSLESLSTLLIEFSGREALEAACSSRNIRLW